MCVSEYDRATSDCIAYPYTRGRSNIARAVEQPLKLIPARSLLKVASDLAPSWSATDSGPIEGKLGRCFVTVVDGGSWRERRVGERGWNVVDTGAHTTLASSHCIP